METVHLSGARIRALREFKKLQPGILAYKAGIGTPHVYRLERGERPNASAVVVGKVARALETTVEYLIGLTDDPGPLQPTKLELDPGCAIRLQEVTQRLAQLPVGVQKRIIEAAMATVNVAEVALEDTSSEE